ncbi:TonB-dependent receptor [Flagellatimonas centrodinii]|uniref:TonB-dependent receptor n=1 Tax=Flagellatimonas centrodinii TaxID=2806210 RepID=UPI001FEDC48F|nr:TonB-dependent receptor [Flagellatimonas centrodinii]ULQ46835.1 TonB-dependent receptor [Flagellatimonas centrodinii]
MFAFPARHFAPVALAAISFPWATLAAQPTATLDTIVVHSNPLGDSADDLVHPVDVISGDALDQRRKGTLGDLLEHRPGLANASFGPGVGRPVIRGQGGPRVQVLENGIGAVDASSVSADHAAAVDPLNAEQVEVIKGPATLIYGGGASAGVVNVVDNRLPDVVIPGLRLQGDLSRGDNGDEANTALRLRYGYQGLLFGARYGLRNADDFDIPGYATRAGAEDLHDHEGHEGHEDEAAPFGVLENSRLRTESLGGSLAWVGSRGMAGIAVTRFDSNYGIAGHSHAHEEEGAEDPGAEGDGVRIDMEKTQTDLRGMLLDPLPGFDRLEVKAGITDYQHQEVEPNGEIGTTFNIQGLDSRVELAHRPFAHWAGVVGLQVGNRDFEAIGEEAFVPPVETDSLGLFWIEGRPFGRHRLELGARVDDIRHQPEDASLGRRSFNPLSLSAGLHLRWREHLHLRLNGQRADRAPAPEEIYAYGPHLATLAFERGDAGADMETAHNLDLSLSRDDGPLTWTVGVFYNRISDYLYLQEVDDGLNADGSGVGNTDGVADRVDESGTFDPDGELLLLDVTQRDATFYGAELSARLQAVRSGGLQLDLSGFADTVRGQLESGRGDNLPRITPARAGVAADLRHGPWSGRLTYTRVFEQNRLAPLETNTPGHDLVGADLAYRLKLGEARVVTLYLQGRNLLDEKQRLATSFIKDISPQPGRSLFAGVRFDFRTPD